MQTGVGAVEGDANVRKKFRAIWRSQKKVVGNPLWKSETKLVALGVRDRMHAIVPKWADMWARLK